MPIQIPDWVKHAVFYQIFPDRFARSSRTTHPRGIHFKPWGSPPSEQGFQGGDLYGVVDHLDYLQNLGVTAIYLNPIFASAANHRYHTFDYMHVDPLLGGDAALCELLDEAHARDMKVILDGVFNHAGRGFRPFHDVLENGANSPYIDWFHIYDWPLRPYQQDEHHPANYAAWWGIPALPKLNTSNPGVRDTIMQVARSWIDFGIDGWRLDVPSEIDDDEFWCQFRQVVKDANPQAYICGEIWGPAQRWLQGDQFDAVMNYQFTGAALSFAGQGGFNPGWSHNELQIMPQEAGTFASRIETMLQLYAWPINLAQLNIIDSHDTPRALWIMNHDIDALQLVVLLQMTLPGAPCIYYGDEIGLATGPDPENRQAFPWDTPEQWNHELHHFYRQATALRHSHPVLRTGDYATVYAQGAVFAFRRSSAAQQALVVISAAPDPQTIALPQDALDAESMQQVWPQQPTLTLRQQAGEWHITLPPRAGAVWASAPVAAVPSQPRTIC